MKLWNNRGKTTEHCSHKCDLLDILMIAVPGCYLDPVAVQVSLPGSETTTCTDAPQNVTACSVTLSKNNLLGLGHIVVMPVHKIV